VKRSNGYPDRLEIWMPDRSAFNALSDPPNKTAILFHGLNAEEVINMGKWDFFMIRLTFGPMYPNPILDDTSVMLRGQHMNEKRTWISGNILAVRLLAFKKRDFIPASVVMA